MKVARVVLRRVRQVRQYEPEEITLDIELELGESAEVAIDRARHTIAKAFNEPYAKGQEFR